MSKDVQKQLQRAIAALARRHRDYSRVDKRIKEQAGEMAEHQQRRLAQYAKIIEQLGGDTPDALGEEYLEELDGQQRAAKAHGMFPV